MRETSDPVTESARRQRWYYERGGRALSAESQRRWVAENPERAREQVRRYQARKLAATVEEVDYVAILERDGMACHICGSEIPDLANLHARARRRSQHGQHQAITLDLQPAQGREAP